MNTSDHAIEWNRDKLIPNRQTVSKLLLLADALVESSELREAEKCFRQAIFLADQMDGHNDTRCDAFVSFGRLLVRLNAVDEAEQWLRRAESLIESGKVQARDHGGTYEVLATICRQRGDSDIALRYCTLAEKASADIAEYLHQRSRQAKPTRSIDPADMANSEAKAGLKSHPTPDLWKRILDQSRTKSSLPIPTMDEVVCIAGVALCVREQQQPTVTADRLRVTVRSHRPTWDGFEVRKVAQCACDRGFLQSYRVNEDRTDRPMRSMNSQRPSFSVAYQLAMPPEELVAAICGSILSIGRMTDESRECIQLLAETLLLDESKRASLFEWMDVM